MKIIYNARVRTEKDREYAKKYRESHRLQFRAYQKKYEKSDKGKECWVRYSTSDKRRLFLEEPYKRAARKENYRNWAKIYNQTIGRKMAQRARRQRPEVKAQIRAYNASYKRQRVKTDILFKLKTLLRARLYNAIRGNFKSGSAIRELGCSIRELQFYLEGQFQDGMTWKNWSPTGWHIDHKIPLAFFDLTDRKQLLKACHYTNLQPLWSNENIRKGDKLIPTQVVE